MPPVIQLILFLSSVKRYGMTKRLQLEIDRMSSVLPVCDVRYAYRYVYEHVEEETQ